MDSAPLGRHKPFPFRPPKNSRLLIRLAKWLLPLILRTGVKVTAVEIREEDLTRLQQLAGQRVVLTPNHGGSIEPFILFHLSKLLCLDFNYLAAKEAFERRPAAAWFLQRLGGYSVVRGTLDKKSFRTTQDLLVEGKHWLVIFPEGEVGWQTDTIMPFQEGGTQLAFWAYTELARRGESFPLYLVPIAIRYVYLQDMSQEIDRSLERLERKLLAAVNSPPLSRYDRLRRVGEAVLVANEKKYGIQPQAETDLEERVQQIRERILSRIEATLGLPSRPGQPLLARIRDLLNAVERIVLSDAEGAGYEQQLHHELQQQARGLYEDLSRVMRFIAVHDGYVREAPTAERFLDILGLLELEVFERRRFWGPRKALIKAGDPVEIGQYFPRYQNDKRGVIQEITILLETRVRQSLAELHGQPAGREGM